MINITNECNMELMARYPDGYFDLGIIDAPYGLERFKKGGSHINKYGSEKGLWNNEKPKKEFWNELFRVCKKHIIWGANNFELPTSEYFIIWQKSNAPDFSFAMCEYAWTNCKVPAKIFKNLHVENREKRIHSTQKPVKLYEWLLMNYAKEGDKILDTHLGSGSIAIACHNLGFDLTGCELDPDYYNAAMKRLKQHQQQIRMF